MLVQDQILAICEEQGIPLGRRRRIGISDALYDGIHRSILSGYLFQFRGVQTEKFLHRRKKPGSYGISRIDDVR